MSLVQYVDYSDKAHLQFYCLRCVCDVNGKFNFPASLARIKSHAPDISRMRLQAESENKLLSLYRVALPQFLMPCSDDVVVHAPSVSLLQKENPWILHHFVPATVGEDGNCLFRAVALALYCDEGLYARLRLLATIEALLHPELYDDRSSEFYAPYKADDRLVLPKYDDFVTELARDSSYSDMLTVLVLSSVTQKPIQTRWPIVVDNSQASPMTKLVTGRGVQTVHPVDILWTTTDTDEHPTINHFVPLIDLPPFGDLLQSADVEGVEMEVDGENDDDSDGVQANDDSMDDAPPPRPTGQPLSGHFLTTNDCVSCLSDNSYDPVYDTVPLGVKENVMFKVAMEKGKEGCKYWDDCGAWVKSHGKKTYHLMDKLTEVHLKEDGIYRIRKRVDGEIAFVPLEPQPQQVIVLHRLYSKLRRHQTYQRRVTYMEGCDFFLAEYLGDFPDIVEPHGNAKRGAEYVRSHPRVLSDIATALQSNKRVKKTYEDLKAASDNDLARPRDKKQVTYIATSLTIWHFYQ